MPMSLLCTCCLIGRIETKMAGENEICCELGVKGAACCFLFSTVFYGPPGFILYNIHLRKKVIEQYNVSPSDITCSDKCCYPCSYFQMLVSLQEWDNERRASEIHSHKQTPQKDDCNKIKKLNIFVIINFFKVALTELFRN